MLQKKHKWYKSLWLWVLVFMCLGIIFGVTVPSLAKQSKPLIDIFIYVIKIMIGPVVFLTVVRGIVGIGSLRRLGSIGMKSFIYFELVSSFALIVGLSFGYTFHPGCGMNLSVIAMDSKLVSKYVVPGADLASFSQVFLSAIPSNPFTPFVEGNTLQVLFIAVCISFIIFFTGKPCQNKVLSITKKLQDYVFKLLYIVMLFSPILAFASMAFMVGQFGMNIISHMLGLILIMIAACMFFILVVLGSIAYCAGFSILSFLKLIKDEIILVFATSSSESALVPIMNKLTESGASESVVGIVVPAGYSFNLDGTNIYLSLVVVFLCNAFNIHLEWYEYFMVMLILMTTSKGSAGISGAGFIVLAGTLAKIHGYIPVETIGILLGIDKIMSELRSTTNLVGNSLATIVIAKWEKQLNIERFKSVLVK